MITVFGIAALGAVGVLCRYGLGLWIPSTESGFPLATFAINFLGAVAIAWVNLAAAERQWISPQVQQILQVGLLGGFTTFSAYSLDCWKLIQNGQLALASSYALGTPVICLGGVYLGCWLARL